MPAMVRGIGVQRLAASRRKVADRLASLLTDSLGDIDHEDGGVVLDGLACDVDALLDQVQRLDRHICDVTRPGLRDDLGAARGTIRALVMAMTMLPSGGHQAGKLLAGGIVAQVRRLQRVRAELDKQLK
jgi:hypothetical protein